ncbi:uncharacterized protein VTP21DRAFT_10518 [Calcarisporiella thermophila]|uniref:uncharacterized protein n=1 Tax=Calcarisporiella thermophila TaxID=911321 RepID=UPI003743B8CA
MNTILKTARAAATLRPAQYARRYATEAPASGKLRLNFVLPHETIFKNTEVQQVNIAATTGDMGVLANHVPSIEQLAPGVVEVIENIQGGSKKYFVSGGFAVINPDSTLNINAVEAFSLEDFSLEAVKSNLSEAQRLASAATTEEERAAAKVEVEVFEALQAALSK